MGHCRGIANSLAVLGNVALAIGNPDEAKRFFRESLPMYRKLGHRPGTADILKELGIAALVQGEFAKASRLFQRSLAIHE